jgi:enoyl-CoA hydratase/carnithine racemase
MQSFADGALVLDLAGDIATLTLNRPERRNALNAAMWQALPQACAAVEASPAKLLILRGAGGHFAAGADISEFDKVYADRQIAGVYADGVHDAVNALAKLDRPVLAHIEGFCVGAGSALALACDIRLAAVDARFGITPAKLGLMYNLADTKRLVDAVGPGKAKDILFTGRLLDADEALAFGLVDFVIPTADLETAVAAKAAMICANSQWSIRASKRVIRQILDGAPDDTDETRRWFVDAVLAEDFLEGRAAFMGKRSPDFKYR